MTDSLSIAVHAFASHVNSRAVQVGTSTKYFGDFKKYS